MNEKYEVDLFDLLCDNPHDTNTVEDELKLSDIRVIKKSSKASGGYDIVLNDSRIINVHNRRCIGALLILIKNGVASEEDLSRSNTVLPEIKKELKGKLTPNDLIRDYYADTHKPFGELWTEEGFSCITSDNHFTYNLKPSDHNKLFSVIKNIRKAPTVSAQKKILKAQNHNCNICASKIKSKTNIQKNTFQKDRSRLSFDHRIPVEKGGNSEDDNFQALCSYCNRSKLQICNICDFAPAGCLECALAFPEKTSIVYPTKEDIKDRMKS